MGNSNSSNVTVTYVEPVDTGSPSTGFITWGAGMVFFMTPGLALFYSGLSKHNNALSLMMLCMLAMAVVTVQFFLYGFSLAFSESGGPFIGDFKMGALNTLGSHSFPHTSPQIPSIAFMVYQMQFATLTAALIFGSVPERTRFVPAMIFTVFWTTFVYDFVAYWTWADRGWIRNFSCIGDIYTAMATTNSSSPSAVPCQIGGYDFAGGGPVHIASGFAGLAYCLVLGKRKHIHVEHHSLVNVMFGTGILWFGWLAFNGGSEGAANTRAAMASTNTTIAAACGALTWIWFDFIWTRKLSALSFCSGAVAGLVGITPAAGFVAPWAAIVIGFLTALACNSWCRVKKHIGFDDSFDAFSVHGCGGFIGNILTGIFAQKWVGKLDGTDYPGGWLEGNWIQVGYQLGGSTAIAVWSFTISGILCLIINKIPYLHLRQTETDEALGGDFVEMGEVGYMLVISEPEGEILDDEHAFNLGTRHDGKRISMGDALHHNSDARSSVGSKKTGSSFDILKRPHINRVRGNDSEVSMSSFTDSASAHQEKGASTRQNGHGHSHGVVNFAADVDRL
ncbi:Ammonium transporter 1 [Hypsibius exemplaris]|uniref:Ammonium transporter n=1 Tax=Hypsibius exemplaris TaxID=2072580 RepID=A0A9X6NH10_HYPEX|nr:Ammonium transporter 1 [Hypsibius exemplaris]